MNLRLAVFLLAAAAGICAIVGAVSDWVDTPIGAAAGTDANAGKTTLIAAAVGIAFAAVAVRLRWLALLGAVAAGIAGAVSGYYASDPDAFVDPLPGDLMWGLALSALGSIALFVLCLALLAVPDRRAAPAAAA